jgi:hypothetical protein
VEAVVIGDILNSYNRRQLRGGCCDRGHPEQLQ